ncbi:hypothetical protein Tco_0332895 [Tanacetum coccineum]
MDSMIPNGQRNTLAEYMILSGADNRLPMLDKDLKIQADCDMKAINISLQGLSTEIYLLVNHHRIAKDLWERVQLLMQGDDPIACLKWQSHSATSLEETRKGKVILVMVIRVMLLVLEELMQIDRQCTQPKRPRNAAWFRDKAMLAEV